MNAAAAIGRVEGRDVLPALAAYALVLLLIPSVLIVEPLGAAGTPAQIIGVAMLCWWLASRVVGRPATAGGNPVKWLLFVFVLALLASYVAGMSRPIFAEEEVKSADRALLSLCAWCGVALVVMDGITERARLKRLLKVIAGGVTGVAVVGLLQFFLRLDLAKFVRIPGLTANHAFGVLVERSAYERVTGTTSHPIEFGVVLSAALPILIHLARFADSPVGRRRWWIATAIVAVSLPLAVARSGIIGAVVVVAYLFYTWPRRLKIRMTIVGVLGLLMMSSAVPGLLGTIKGLFLHASSDPSTQGRTADYAPVLHYLAQHPVFGRGIGTFVPSLYRTLDNQYLGVLVESGVAGLLAMLTLLIGTGFVAGSIRRRSTSEETRDLCQGIKAGCAVVTVNSALFDSLGFPMCAGLTFLLIGMTGAVWNMERRRLPRPAPADRTTSNHARRIPIRFASWRTLSAAVAATALGFGALGVLHSRPEFEDFGSVILTPTHIAGRTVYGVAGDANMMTSILHDVLEAVPTRERVLRGTSASYELAVGDGSLMMDTDVQGLGSPILRLVTTAPTPAESAVAMKDLLRVTRRELLTLQTRVGLSPRDAIGMQVVQNTGPVSAFGRPSRARLACLIIVVLVCAAWTKLPRTPSPDGRPKAVVGMQPQPSA